jgi:hypothetical protein
VEDEISKIIFKLSAETRITPKAILILLKAASTNSDPTFNSKFKAIQKYAYAFACNPLNYQGIATPENVKYLSAQN